MTDLTPLTRAQCDAYRRRVEKYEAVSHDRLPLYECRIMQQALFDVDGFLAMGVFAGDEICLPAELMLDELQGGFVEQMIHRCHVSAATWRAGQ